MMKFTLIIIFFMFIFFKISSNLLQLIFQNFIFFLLFMFLIKFPMNNMNMWMIMYKWLGCDFYSLGLILLMFWIMSLMMMMSLMNFISYMYMYYVNIMIFMMLFLFICFNSMNIMMFYFFFESSLIPVFMLIMGWGFQVERIQAGFYMMLYTLFGSLPLLFMLIWIYNMNYTLMFDLIQINFLNLFMYIYMIIAFLIKMPMYMFHLWLPKAHVEAPLTGSMILAGIMLKLGSYGLMRFMIMMMSICMKFNKFIIIISLMGGLYSGLICLCQVDMKMLVAYSSVVHMSILMSGMMTLYSWGYLGGMLMMLAHGLCSSGLFCLVNMNYERLSSRSLFINKGMINFMPSLSLMWFLLCSSNLSFPPSLNLFSEIFLLNSLIMWNKDILILLMVILFFSASYSLYLYSYSQHGLFKYLMYMMKVIMINEYLLLILHWLPLNVLFMSMYIYIN